MPDALPPDPEPAPSAAADAGVGAPNPAGPLEGPGPVRRFARLPLDLLRSAELSPAEKVVALALVYLDPYGHGTDATDLQVGQTCGLGRSQVSLYVNRLVERGLWVRSASGSRRALTRVFRFERDASPTPGLPATGARTPGRGASWEIGRGRPDAAPPAPGNPGASARYSGRSLLEEKKNQNLQKAGSVARAPGDRPRPTPPGTEAGQAAAPAASRPDRALGPCEVAWLSEQARGPGFPAKLAASKLDADRHRASSGAPSLPFDEAEEAFCREQLLAHGLPLPAGADAAGAGP